MQGGEEGSIIPLTATRKMLRVIWPVQKVIKGSHYYTFSPRNQIKRELSAEPRGREAEGPWPAGMTEAKPVAATTLTFNHMLAMSR